MALNKKTKILVIIAVIVLAVILLVSSVVKSYNNLVSLNGNVEEKQSVISTQLQRRNDLIPNLVSTVKGYAKHEADVFKNVTEARSKVMGADTVKEQAEASAELSREVSTLLNFTFENYPELKANQNFIVLKDALEGAENRIGQARIDYNEAVKNYNVKIRKFPTNIFAGIFGFEAYEYFEAEAGAEKVPEVSFE